jgi:hypothetical protein
MSRVRDLFERVDDDLVNNCTVDAAAARPPTAATGDVVGC